MPYRRRYRRRRRQPRRRRYRRRRRSYLRPTVTRGMGLNFGDTLKIKLPTAGTFATINAAGPILRAMYGNNIRDPSTTAGFNRPALFTELFTIYGRVFVRASKIQVVVHNNAAEPLKAGLIPSVAQETTFLPEDCIQNYGQWRFMPPSGSSSAYGTMWGFMTTAKMSGQKRINDPQAYSHTSTADPVYPWFWNIVMDNVDATGSVQAQVSVKIIYYCEFIRTDLSLLEPNV